MSTFQCPDCGEVDCICPCDVCGKSGCRGDGISPCTSEKTSTAKTPNLLVGEWISVDVELPPVNEKGQPKRVLVFSEEYGKSGSSPFQFAKYIESRGGWIVENGQGYLRNMQVPWKVTHWAKVKKPQE